MSKIDLIRAKARGETGADAAAAPPRPAEAKPAPARPPSRPRRPSGPRPGPASSGSATPGSHELAERINAELGAGHRHDRPGGLARPGRQARRRRPLPARPEPDQVRLPGQPPERPLRGLHRGQLPARQHRQARQADRAAGPHRRGRGPGRGPLALSRLPRGRFPGARGLRHDGRPLHGPPRAEAHPDVGRLRLLPAPQGLPRALLRRARPRSSPAGSTRASASTSAPRSSTPTART